MELVASVWYLRVHDQCVPLHVELRALAVLEALAVGAERIVPELAAEALRAAAVT